MLSGLLGGIPFLDQDAGGSGYVDIAVKGILIGSGLLLLLWCLVRLRRSHMRAGDVRGWQNFCEWGVPVTLVLLALMLVCVGDGGEVDRVLVRAHWVLLQGVQRVVE